MKAITRPLLIGAAVVIVGVVVVSLVAARGIERDLVDGRVRELDERVSWLAADIAEAMADEDLEFLADTLAARAGGRVGLLDAAGRVIGDSAPDGADPLQPGLPEVARALAGQRGERRAGAMTDEQAVVHLAVPVVGRPPVAVVRLSSPLGPVARRVARIEAIHVAFVLGTIGVAALVLLGAAARIARVQSVVEGSLARLAAAEPPIGAGPEELGALGGALARAQEAVANRVAELRGEHQRLAGVLRDMANGVLLLDERGRVALVNPALREMLILPSDAVGRPLLEVIRRADLKQLIDEAIKSEAPSQRELELDGMKPRRLLVRAAPAAEGTREILVLCVDVTDLRRLESHRRDFVANVSHELRTPVTAVRSAVETLRMGAVGDEAMRERFLDIIERNAERLQHLVEDLLDLARIEKGELKLAIESLGVAAVLARAVDAVAEEARRREITVTVEAPDDLMVRADRRGLEQVLANLLGNALKYCPAGARVTAMATAAGDARTRIAVIDTGPGIEARHLPRLFQRFYRVDAGRSREVGGTGLGLSIVKHLVEAMGGTVGVDSTVGKGTTFWLELPA